jgi:hypothetical protein
VTTSVRILTRQLACGIDAIFPGSTRLPVFDRIIPGRNSREEMEHTVGQ